MLPETGVSGLLLKAAVQADEGSEVSPDHKPPVGMVKEERRRASKSFPCLCSHAGWQELHMYLKEGETTHLWRDFSQVLENIWHLQTCLQYEGQMLSSHTLTSTCKGHRALQVRSSPKD